MSLCILGMSCTTELYPKLLTFYPFLYCALFIFLLMYFINWFVIPKKLIYQVIIILGYKYFQLMLCLTDTRQPPLVYAHSPGALNRAALLLNFSLISDIFQEIFRHVFSIFSISLAICSSRCFSKDPTCVATISKRCCKFFLFSFLQLRVVQLLLVFHLDSP